MARQRPRGQTAKAWAQVETTDRRGNKVMMPANVVDPDAEPIVFRGAFVPQRSSRAELAGQQQINVYRVILDPDVELGGLWAMVEWRGLRWDVVTPPQYHEGSRHVRHITIDIRQRPDRPVA